MQGNKLQDVYRNNGGCHHRLQILYVFIPRTLQWWALISINQVSIACSHGNGCRYNGALWRCAGWRCPKETVAVEMVQQVFSVFGSWVVIVSWGFLFDQCFYILTEYDRK